MSENREVDLLDWVRYDVVRRDIDDLTVELARMARDNLESGVKCEAWLDILARGDWGRTEDSFAQWLQDLTIAGAGEYPGKVVVRMVQIPLPTRLRLAVHDYIYRNQTRIIPHSHMELRGATARLVVEPAEQEMCCVPINSSMLYTHCLSYNHVARVWCIPPAGLHTRVYMSGLLEFSRKVDSRKESLIGTAGEVRSDRGSD